MLSISRISVVTRDKNENENYYRTFSANENRKILATLIVIKLRLRPTYNELRRHGLHSLHGPPQMPNVQNRVKNIAEKFYSTQP